jgi:hypothetical protein
MQLLYSFVSLICQTFRLFFELELAAFKQVKVMLLPSRELGTNDRFGFGIYH